MSFVWDHTEHIGITWKSLVSYHFYDLHYFQVTRKPHMHTLRTYFFTLQWCDCSANPWICYSQTRSSVATRLSFWHLLTSFWLVWWLPVWNGPITFSEQAWPRDEKRCMFVCQIQSWKWAGFCKSDRESALAINKYYSCPNFGQI